MSHHLKSRENALTFFLISGSKEVAVLVQNEGENTLKVNLTIPTSMDNSLQDFELLNNQTKKVSNRHLCYCVICFDNVMNLGSTDVE